MDKLVTAHVTETGSSPFAVAITTAGHALVGDEPVASGGANLGPNPFALLTAALAECTAMTIRWYALREKWPLEHVEVTVTHQKGGPGTVSPKQDLFEKSISITGPDLTPEQHAKLLDISSRCPIQRTLEGTPLIRMAQM